MHGSPVCWEFTPHLHEHKPPEKLQWQLCNHHFSEWGRGRKEVRCNQNRIWRVTAWNSKSVPLCCKTAQAPENLPQRIILWTSVGDRTSSGDFLQWMQQQDPRIKPLLPETYEIPNFWWSGHPVPTIPQLNICNAPAFQLHAPTSQ